MTEVKIVKKPDDPLCTRVSMGGTLEIGYYFVYRGSLADAAKILAACQEAVAKQIAQGEPPVEDN